MKQDVLNTPSEAPQNAAYRQKSAGVSLVVIAIITLAYLVNAWQLYQSGAPLAGYLGQQGRSILWIIAIEIALQTVLVIGSGRVAAAGDVDRLAALTGTRNAYFVLMAGVFAALGSLLFNPEAILAANLILLGFLLAEIVRYASQLAVYHRAASGERGP